MITVVPASARYSLDTSGLVNGWGKHYPPDMFGPVWEHVDTLIRLEVVVASVEVLHEIERQSDDLHEWCVDREHAFLDLIDDLQTRVAALLQTYPRLVAAGRNRADPFVIGVAGLDPSRLAVVTEETGQRASMNKPKIPFICQREGIRCVSFVDMLRETGLRL
jgi:hypothetical protein